MCIVLVSCGEKDNNSTPIMQYNPAFVVGEWVSSDVSGNCYTNLILSKSKQASLKIYQNMVGRNTVYQEDKGAWNWYDDRNVLAVSMINNKIPLYEIIEIDSGHMTLRNQSNNTIDTYYHVVQTIEMVAGQENLVDNIFDSSRRNIREYKSSNDSIVSVSKDGVITANQGGVAFIRIKASDSMDYIKVKVLSRMDYFAKMTHMDILGVRLEYGKPDMSGKLNENINAIVYTTSLKDPKLEAIEIDFDKSTSEVKYIITRYKSSEKFFEEKKFIDCNYFKISTNGKNDNIYGEKEIFWDNSYYLLPLITVSGYYDIHYRNLDYNDYDFKIE